MAAVLVALEAYALIEQVNNMYSSARERIEHACRNPTRARHLATVFDQLKTKLAPLAKQCENNHVQFSNQHVQIFKQYIEDLKTTLKTIHTNLEEKITKLNNPLYRFSRALGMNDWLSSIESTARDADRLILVVTSCFANASLTAKNAIAIENVMDAVGALTISPGDEEDEFKPSFDEVPENPPYVMLNFGSKSDTDQGNHESLTVEAKLKRAVLQNEGLQNVAAVGSRFGVTGAKGMSGVGKSCALRGLAKDMEVRGHFRDGIYFMVLGKDATDADVMQNISTIMSTSGSKRMAKEAGECGDIGKAISKAKAWFRGKCILLEIDDVWGESDCLRDIVGRLSSVVDKDVGSRVVFTTRNERMAARSELICFGGRSEEASRQILLSVAGLQDTDVAGCGGIVDGILGYCGGIPMALAVAGSAIKMRLPNADIVPVTDVLQEYAAGLQSCRQRLVKLSVDNDSYTNLESAFRSSLEMLEKNKGRRLAFRCDMSFLVMYRALAVMRRQGWIPVAILRGLWNLKDVSQAIDVMQELVEACLAEREYRMVQGVKVPGITLHDLHLDFVEGEATEHGELEMWHRKVLCMWIGEGGGSSSRESFAVSRDWCKGDLLRDEYVRQNVCRHLMCGGLQDELYLLQTSPEWAAKRLCSGEIVSLEEDIKMLVEYMESEGGKSTVVGSVIWSLNMISGAARLSEPYVSRNGSEVWFQLYGRLFRNAEMSEVVKSYITEIGRCVKGPWLKAVIGGLVEPGGALRSAMLCKGRVYGLSEMGEDGKLVVCGKAFVGDPFVSTFVNGQEERTVWLSSDRASDHDDDGYNDVARDGEEGPPALELHLGSVSSSSRRSLDVSAISCTRDGSRVVTGHDDGSVQIWEAMSGKAVGASLVGHSSSVECVAWSLDGKRVASGGYHDTMRFWDVEKGEAMGDGVFGHDGTVVCLAWSDDGKRVASGGGDRMVRVWDAEKGEAIGDALVGHRDWVSSVAWSPDGKLIVSGGDDGAVRTWDAEKGEAVGHVLVGHSERVWCVAWSPDAKLIASAGYDGTVCIWDVEKRKAIRETQVGHNRWVRCMAYSAEGRLIPSGGSDTKLRFWDVETGEAAAEALAGHSGWVRCVTWSADGKQLASGGADAKARLWYVETGEAVAKPLIGHGVCVLRLAWSPDGKWIASGGADGSVIVWDAEKGEAVGEALVWLSVLLSNMAWSRDCNRIAFAGRDGTMCIWDIEKGGAVVELPGSLSGLVRCMAWSPDDKRIASGGEDGTVHVWDVERGETVGDSLVGHSDRIRCVAWSRDGTRIASGGDDCKVRLWEVESGKCLSTEEGWVNGDLSRLNLLLGEEDVRCKDEGEAKLRVDGGVDVLYSFRGKETKLGTLEREAVVWEYSKACRSIAIGGQDGAVYVWRLLE